MTTKTRIITTGLAIVLTMSAAFVGYSIGAANADMSTAQEIRAAQCAAIQGLNLTPKIPYLAHTPACVWSYQITLDVALQRGANQCLCG